MTAPINPFDEIGKKYNSKQVNPFDAIGEQFSQPTDLGLFGRGASAALGSAGQIAGNVFGGLGWVAEKLGKERSGFSDIADSFLQTANRHKKLLEADPAKGFTENAVEIGGKLAPQMIVGTGIAKALTPATSLIANTRFGDAARRIGEAFSKKPNIAGGIATGIASVPAEMAGSYASTALMNPEDLGGALPIIGGVAGSGLTTILAAKGITSSLKQAIKASPRTQQVIDGLDDPTNQLFMTTVESAKSSMAAASKLYRKSFLNNSLLEVPKEISQNLTAINRVLKSFEVDGVSVTNVSKLEGLQTILGELVDNFEKANWGLFDPNQVKALKNLKASLDGIKLPQYNWASATPAVSAIQRLQDNLEVDDALRLDPSAPIGTVESLIAGTRPKVPSAQAAIPGWFSKQYQQFVNYKSGTKVFNQLAPNDKVNNPYEMLLRLSGNNGRVYQNLEVQPKLYNPATKAWEDAKIDGQQVLSMRNVLEIAGTDDASLAKLNGYVVAKQVADGNLRITGFTPEWAAKELVRIEQEAPHIKEAGEHFFRRGKMMAQYMRDLVGDDIADEWMKRDYAPASRALMKEKNAFGFLSGRTGGDELVYNPVSKHIENVSVAIAATEKTRVWQRMHDLLEGNGGMLEGVAEIVDVNPTVLQRTLDAVKKANPDLAEPGKEIAAMKVAQLIIGNSPDKSTQSVSFLKNGKLQTIRFTNDFHELFQGFEGPGEMSGLADFARKVESVPRTAFSLVNDLTMVGPLRDIAEVYVNDPNIVKNPMGIARVFVDAIRGLKEVSKEGELYQRVMAAGGGIGGRYVGPTGGIVDITYQGLLKKAAGESESFLRKMEQWSANLSQASRMGAAMRVFEKGGSDAEAAKLFRAVIADPQQVGSKMQAAARMTAFMNMGIQSVDKVAHQFKNNRASTVVKGIEGIAIPAATLWWWNKDDAEIQQLRNSKGGENYFYLRMTPEMDVIRFPKPYLYGQVFGTGMETFLDEMWGKNPQAVEQLVQGIWNQTATNIIPLTTQSLVNTTLGQKYLGLGEGLIPAGGSTNNQMAADQRFMNTTTLARKIAEGTGIAASSIDDLMRTFLTNEPFKVVSAIDRKVTGRTEGTREDVPLFGKFKPTIDKSNVGSLNRFYDMSNKYSDVLASFQDAANKGDGERLQKLMTIHKEDLQQAMVFKEGLADIQELRSTINMINENKMLTPAERREKINELFKAMRDYSTMFLEAWDSNTKK